MKKSVIISIAVIAIAAFGLVVYYGFTHTRGVPVKIEEVKRAISRAPYMEKEVDLAKGIGEEFWATVPGQEIKLVYQVMILPWPKVITPAVMVKAFRNNKDIYFYMTWKDETEDRIVGINKFSDGCAVMFPLEKRPQTPTLMMGFLGKTNIWHWKASRDEEYWGEEHRAKSIEQRAKGKGQALSSMPYADFYYPFEDKETLTVSKENIQSAVNDLISIRVATVTPKESQNVTGRGLWKEGVWQVVFKRSINADNPEVDAVFEPGKRLCAFAVWNGSKGDRGGRKSISDWVELDIK